MRDIAEAMRAREHLKRSLAALDENIAKLIERRAELQATLDAIEGARGESP